MAVQVAVVVVVVMILIVEAVCSGCQLVETSVF